jgi:hypothetical protein
MQLIRDVGMKAMVVRDDELREIFLGRRRESH